VRKSNAKLAVAPEPAPLLKLDLGSGDRVREGFEGVDIVQLPNVKHVVDLRKTPWPWKDESVGEAHTSHFMEHLTGEERIAFMEELWRVLVVGGTCSVIVPYWASMRSIQDPFHKWPPMAESSFLYFNKGWRESQMLGHYPIKCDFDYNYGYSIAPQWQQKAEEPRQYAISNFVNAVMDLHVTLTKRGANGK